MQVLQVQYFMFLWLCSKFLVCDFVIIHRNLLFLFFQFFYYFLIFSMKYYCILKEAYLSLYLPGSWCCVSFLLCFLFSELLANYVFVVIFFHHCRGCLLSADLVTVSGLLSSLCLFGFLSIYSYFDNIDLMLFRV